MKPASIPFPHFPTFLDCRTIHVREVLDLAGVKTQTATRKHMSIALEIILGVKPQAQRTR